MDWNWRRYFHIRRIQDNLPSSSIVGNIGILVTTSSLLVTRFHSQGA